MGIKPKPENVQKIAQVDQLLADYPRMSIPDACRKVELNPHTYHSALAKRRERAEEAESWAWVGKARSQ